MEEESGLERLDEWMVFDRWEVATGGQRVIFTNKPDRGFLVDFTIAEPEADQIIASVLSQKWTNSQLMDYLDVLIGEKSTTPSTMIRN